MIGRILLLSVLLLLILPVGCFAEGGTAPLTLLKKPDTTTQTAPSQPNKTISSQDEELRDIHGPVPTTARPPYLLIAGIILFVLLAAAAIIWFFKRKTPPPPPPVPPWEKALLELSEARKWLTPERALVYMDRVSQILRGYIESRFAIQSTRQTTREFLQSLAAIGTTSPLQTHKPELQAFLEQADMAKFAHHAPEIKNLEKMEKAVITFIKRTEPAEPPKGSRPQKQVKKSLQAKGDRP